MKKIVALLSFIAVVGQASISVDFSTTQETFKDSGGDWLMDNLFMAFFSADQSFSGYTAGSPETPSGNDVFLGAYSSNPTGAPVFIAQGNIVMSAPLSYDEASYTLPAGVTTFTGGYVYVAVFDLLFASYAGSVPGGTEYVLAPLTAAGPAQTYVTTDLGTILTPFKGDTNIYQTVPEPAAMLFVAVGALVLGFRRLRGRA